MELRLAFIGFGNVARAFARMLRDRRSRLDQDYGLRWKTTGIATKSHGCITSRSGIDLLEAASCVESGGNLPDIDGSTRATDSNAVIETCDANIVFDATPLNINNGEPAVTYIRAALARGIHVITANKGPVAFAYSEFKDLAPGRGVSFRFEGTVMDGAPIFNLVERCLPGARVQGFRGVLNSTTNLILTEMESGRSFEDSLEEARRRGIAEANAEYDIDGWDAAVKTVVLANVLMNGDSTPDDVDRKGIRDIKLEEIRSAGASGLAVRLVARANRSDDGLTLTVSPEKVPIASPLGFVRGTSNVLILETDLMGEIAIIENDPGTEQTAYALLSDMIAVHELERSRV